MAGITFYNDGQFASGVGGGGAWANNQPLAAPPAGIACAWTGDWVLYQSAVGTIRAIRRNGTDDYEVSNRPATFLAADNNGNFFASYLADGHTGVVTSDWQTWPQAGLLGVIGNTIFLKTDFNTGGISAWQSGAMLWSVPAAQPVPLPVPQFSALDPQRCCWTEGGRLKAQGLPEPAQTEAMFDPCVVDLHGTLWLAYHGGPVVLRLWGDASQGYILNPAGGYYTTARVVDATHIEVAWSVGPSAAGDVQTVIQDLTAPMVPLGQPPPDPLPPVHIDPFHAPIYVGPFFATDIKGQSVDHPGNCEVLIRGDYAHEVRKRPTFADLDSAKTVPNGKLVGIYCSAVEGGTTDPNIQQAIAYAGERGVPVLVYSDTDDYPQWICDKYLNAPNRIPVVRAYPLAKKQGEPLKATPAQDVARTRATVAQLATIYPRVAIAHTYYTQSDNYPLRHILAMQEGLAAIERDYKLFASLGFSRARGGGDMSTYPELAAAFKEECRATPGEALPILLPVPEPPHPQPPDPQPEPPQPHPPEITTMVLIDETIIKENQPLPDAGKMVPYTLVPVSGGVAAKKANGCYMTVTPGGDVQQRPENGVPDPNYKPGAWETFRVSGGFLVSENEGHVYAFRCIGA